MPRVFVCVNDHPDKYLNLIVRLLTVSLFLGAGWAGSAQSAWAQHSDEEARYTFALVGVSLSDALRTAMERTQLDLFFDAELVAEKRTFCTVKDQPQEAVLRCILKDTGLDFYRLSTGTYILMEEFRTAPRYGSLAGRIVDAETGSPLAYANVLLSGENTGTATNSAGRFALSRLAPGPHRLVVTHVAYEDKADTVWVDPQAQRTVDLALKARAVMIAPVVVNGLERRLPSQDLGTDRRSSPDLLNEPSATADVLQTLDALVGVQGGDALSEVHVQGGAAGEHQYLLDGANVFMPIQNGGFIGPFSPFALKQITVHKAGFEASRGSHLAGVIAVEHDLTPSPGTALVIQADQLSMNGRMNGSVGKPGKMQAQWMVAARKELWDVFRPDNLEARFRSWSVPNPFLLDALDPEAEAGTALASQFALGRIDLTFFDFHAATRIQQGGLRSLYASLYRGRNVFSNGVLEEAPASVGVVADEYTWTNQTAQMRYEWVQGSRAFAHVGLWKSSYRLDHPFNRSPLGAIAEEMPSSPTDAPPEFNEIETLGFRGGLDYAIAARHTLTGSLEASLMDSDFWLAIDPLGHTPVATPGLLRPMRWRWHAVFEDAFALSYRTTLTLGTRLTYLHAQGLVYAEPRLALRHDVPAGPGGTWAFRTAVGRYRQFINQFDVAPYSVSALLPSFRFWLPLGRDVAPSTAYHLAGDVLFMPDDAWAFRLETYYKHQPNLVELDYGSRLAETPTVLTDGDGYAYGIGLSARRTGRRARIEGSYEYARARRRIENRFDGRFMPAPWETPHQLRLGLDLTPRPRWTATLRWRAVWGRSWGFRQAYYDYLEPDPATQVFAGYNLSDPAAHRLPVFSQVDVGLAYTHQVGPMRVQARVNLINAFGRHNVIDWGLDTDEASGHLVRTVRTATPFVPLFSLQTTW